MQFLLAPESNQLENVKNKHEGYYVFFRSFFCILVVSFLVVLQPLSDIEVDSEPI